MSQITTIQVGQSTAEALRAEANERGLIHRALVDAMWKAWRKLPEAKRLEAMALRE